ncbi:MAG TPA: hypothetical protein VD907_06495 [Verrucomicrobiae bacterium]|nr:hypothetical protein [Verrucomicrobiae bacterium]
MNKNNVSKTAVSYTSWTWLAVIGAILAAILSIVGWALKGMWPNIENLEIGFLVLLTVGDIIWILVLLGVYERLTLTGQLLTQTRIGRRVSIDLSQLVSVEPAPVLTKSTRRPYKIFLKDIQGNQLELYGNKFHRHHFQDILVSIRDAVANQQIVQEKDRSDVDRILADWQSGPSLSRKLFNLVKYTVTGIAIIVLAISLNSEVGRALEMQANCEKVRSEGKITRARVNNISLAYDSNGGRYTMREYPTNDVTRATTLYLMVNTQVDGKDNLSSIRIHGGTQKERISLYTQAKQGTIEVLYSPSSPNFIVLANAAHADFKICNDI